MKTILTGDLAMEGIDRDMGADDPARLEELERLTGRTLPADYREFLLHFAPCTFIRHVSYRPLEASPWDYNGYQTPEVFFGLDKGSTYDVIRTCERHLGTIPEGTIAISFDAGTNRILLALDEPAGRVYFQDKRTGVSYLCAHTFTDFLKSCEINDDGSEDEI